MKKHIVMFSGGAGSWAAAKRVAKQHGTDNLILLFADTKMEDEDLYRFLREAAQDVGGELIVLEEGRDPWEVFFDKRFLGNSRIDPCSRILKREFLRDWVEANYSPDEAVLYLGIDWTESHRIEKASRYWGDWEVLAPMCDEPFMDKHDILAALKDSGIEPPRLYRMGFPHNNCGGFCIKAGEAHFRLLLETMPERYKQHEQREQELREYLDKDVAILRDRKTRKPLTLRLLRERLEKDSQAYDAYDWGGCGCFSEPHWTELPISSLSLNIRQTEEIVSRGFNTVGDLARALDDSFDPKTIPWVGPTAEKKIHAQIAFFGGIKT